MSIYLFICYLHNLMSLVEYAKKKKSRNPQNILFETYLFIYLCYYYYFKQILGFTEGRAVARGDRTVRLPRGFRFRGS